MSKTRKPDPSWWDAGWTPPERVKQTNLSPYPSERPMSRRVLPPHRSAKGFMVMLAWGLSMVTLWFAVMVILTLTLSVLGFALSLFGIIPIYRKLVQLDARYPRR